MNRASAGLPPAADFLDRWDHHVRLRPGAPALLEGEDAWTYRTADARAEALAARLAAAGAGPGAVVGLALDRPRDAVLGMLAALKAGAAFTVLEDGLPPGLREDLVRRAGATVWLHRAGGAGAPLPDGTPRLEVAGPDPAPPAARPRAGVRDAGRLAYILFTSGSTGRPKGTLIERGALAGFADALRERLALTPSDRWFQVASLGFDVVIEEVFPVLAAGGSVVCRPHTRPLEPEDLHRALHDSAATVVELSTQYWREYARWLDATSRTTPPALRAVLVGGERMDPAAYRAWQQRRPAALVHVYGLTECTVTSTLYTGRLPEDADEVPIGTPLANAAVTVRRDGRVLPWGETGEIHVAGPSLARGYLDDDEQTARRFRADPHDRAPGARTYATGDLGRFLPDGNLVFLGRDDAQLKVRGHRLEAPAVERALADGADVDQAVVLLDPVDGSSLTACLVPADPARRPAPGTVRPLTGEQRRRAVRPVAAALPEWAVPTRTYWVAALPKNPHGKIDTAALAALCATAGERAAPAAVSAPSAQDTNGALTTVLDRFRTVLQAPALGPDDDFFAHGGQSILAMRLVSELRTDLPAAAALRVSALFDRPTPRQLAEHLSGHR
ncbi:non-ribosomal peptide synthetase [Streptomyces luteocolor]|uniref:Nonribosomal peptide synthetase n=1 Tax=Streptomyces luteocolor TaxID=285500 RepID=A0A125SZE0_9ACTN|nr:non-ribosomal peptide synthetase [Streptomyces luteocolor]BAU50944.1 nonribosomal peptide synthetase [Streptomyces luteocolor]